MRSLWRHAFHVVSKESIYALLYITRNPVLLRQIKSITINALTGALHSRFIDSGRCEFIMRQAFINLRRNGNLLDISVVADLSTRHHGFGELLKTEQFTTRFSICQILASTMCALTDSGCTFRDLAVVTKCPLEKYSYTNLLTYMEKNDQVLSSGRSFKISDTSKLNFSIKWENGDNRMHIARADIRESWPVRSSIHSMATLATGNHLRHTVVSHLTVEDTNIADVQWLAESSLRTHFSSITTLDLIDVTLPQASGAASTFFQQLAKMPNLETCRMSGVKIVGSRHTMVYRIELSKVSLEGPDVSDRFKQLGFALEIDLDAWIQQEGVHHGTNWKCTTVGMWNEDTEIDDVHAYIWYIHSLQVPQQMQEGLF
jgi:hypothetical protein